MTISNTRPITPELIAAHGLKPDEYDRILSLIGREPTFTELGIFSAMWNEHCSYKSSKKWLRTLPTSGPRVIQGPGENAGVVDIGDGLAVAFKVESHNHPTAVEPFQGAATGVGGIVRDVFTMGARPIALLDSLRFGEVSGDSPTVERSRYLFSGAVAGIAHYGNCLGIPTVGGESVFDDRYARNPLVNAMCVGLLRHEDLATGSADGVGNPVLAVGARTGRDGIHGATFASVEDPEGRERSAVQVGDPFLEKLLMEACLELIATGDVVGIQDMGAAGLASSSAEMASRAGAGIDLDMLEVPRREQGMTPYELMLSESQERMLVVMRAGREHVAARVLERWGLEAAVIGRVTDDRVLRIREGAAVVAEIPIAALVEAAPEYHRPSERPAYLDTTQAFDVSAVAEPRDYGAALEHLLQSPGIASTRWVWSQYDHMVGTSTVVRPGSDAAVIAIRGTRRAVAVSTDCVGRWVYLDPRVGGSHAVAEAARNVVCSGAQPLAITDCLNFGSPESPEIMWQFEQACAGISEACEVLETPVVSGNVSFYNQSDGIDIYPTPIVGMVGVVEDLDHVTTRAITAAGSAIVAVGPLDATTIGGSEYLRSAHDIVSGACPPLDLALERRVQQLVLSAIRDGIVRAAHDVGQGGIAVAASEMAFGGEIGIDLQLATGAGQRVSDVLFGEAGSIILLELDPSDVDALVARAAEADVTISTIGSTGGSTIRLSVDLTAVVDRPLADLEAAWEGSLACALT